MKNSNNTYKKSGNQSFFPRFLAFFASEKISSHGSSIHWWLTHALFIPLRFIHSHSFCIAFFVASQPHLPTKHENRQNLTTGRRVIYQQKREKAILKQNALKSFRNVRKAGFFARWINNLSLNNGPKCNRRPCNKWWSFNKGIVRIVKLESFKKISHVAELRLPSFFFLSDFYVVGWCVKENVPTVVT